MSVLIVDISSLTPYGSRPRIGYDTVFEDNGAVATASSSVTGFSVANPTTGWLPWKYWAAVAQAPTTHWIRAAVPVARPCNYAALYGHNLALLGASVQAQFSQDGGTTWQNASGVYTPATTECVYLNFTQTYTAQMWRLLITTTAYGAPQVAVCAIGMDMPVVNGMRVKFIPPELGRDTVTTNQRSTNGIFLGRTITRNAWVTGLSIDFATEDWIRNTWMPFVLKAELRTWFMQWNNLKYPFQSALCYADGQPSFDPPAFTTPIFMATGMKRIVAYPS